ncbi:MAG: cupin domain-containing protein [Deltaproteobacteria bacterium]|nr:cupin domain-containing protein [Deltaproteobacteria bacterium]
MLFVQKPIINIDDVPLETFSHGSKFEVQDGAIAPHIGGQLLGYSLAVVPPGKRAYPFHCHHVNEEMFFVLEGRGTLRFGAEEHPIRKGDVIAAPPGGRETAHQLVNTGTDPLRYLMVSTMLSTEVVEYPDSEKVGVYVGSPPGGDPSARSFNFRGRLGPTVDYWEGE